jgi:hypothetical protein
MLTPTDCCIPLLVRYSMLLSRNCRSTTAAAENGQYDIYEAYAAIWSAIMALLSGSGSGDGVAMVILWWSSRRSIVFEVFLL